MRYGVCVVAARLEEVAAAELQQQLAGAVRIVADETEKFPMIEIEVATTAAAAAAATMFERAVTAELTAAAVMWWNECVEKVVVEKRWKYGEWMREWEAMVRWCGGGWWRRLLLIE